MIWSIMIAELHKNQTLEISQDYNGAINLTTIN